MGFISDLSLVPPVRQTVSIFKQPVTLVRPSEQNIKTRCENVGQERPIQVFWVKRLEGLQPCDTEGYKLQVIELPGNVKSVGPHVSKEIIIQSVASILHVSNQPITGQTNSKKGKFINCNQPLVGAFLISEHDITWQEKQVNLARKNLEETLRNSKQ